MMKSDAPSSRNPKICFVSPYNYPLFNPQYKVNFGGWEVQIYNIAKEVARRGDFRVSVIVADMGQPANEVREGVEIIPWKGKTFWGITPPPEPARPAGLPAVPAPETPGWLANLKKIYKRGVNWKVRFILHGLAAGVRNGWRAALLEWRAALRIVRRAVGIVGDMAIMPEMVKVFYEADADLYIAPGVSDISALTAWFCKANRRPYIMLAGSDRDFNPRILSDPNGRNAYGVPNELLLFTIKNADCHIIQNEVQADLARAFDISPVLIPNPINLELEYPKAQNPQNILWVGNTEEHVKQPSLMLELIAQLPEFEFEMIVTPIVAEAYQRLEERAGKLPNVKLLSRIPFREVEQHFARSRIFVSTSVFEGLPNTFLQAGKYGVPVVSLNVDPNRMLSEHDCGLLCAGDQGALVDNIRLLMDDEGLYARMGANIRQYIHEFHDQQNIIPRYEAVFRSALNDK